MPTDKNKSCNNNSVTSSTTKAANGEDNVQSCHGGGISFEGSSTTDDPREILRASWLRMQQQKIQSVPPFPAQVAIRDARNSSSMSNSSSLYPSMDDISRCESTTVSRTTSTSRLPPHFSDSLSSRYNNNFNTSDSMISSSNEVALSERVASTAAVATSEAFFIPSEQSDVNDDDLIALKIAAIKEAETEVEAIVEYDMIHPLEEESVVRAEFVCQRENNLEQQQSSVDNTQYYETTYDSQGRSSNEEVATEATVIESGPPEKATIAAWSGDTTPEAVVLQQQDSGTSYECINDLDRKPPAIQFGNDLSNDIIPLREYQQQQQQQSYENENASATAENNAIATVVDYDVHPSEMMERSAQAEFVGRSSVNVAAVNRAENISEINETEETTTEATVLDSGPIEKATIEAWSTMTTTEEAQVLIEDNYDINVARSNIAIVKDTDTSNDNQAEIVEISERVHPAEFELEAAATAELIGDSDHALDDATILDEIDGQNEQPIITPAAVLGVDDSTNDHFYDYPKKLISNECLENEPRDYRATESESIQSSSLECHDTDSCRAPSSYSTAATSRFNNEGSECTEDPQIPTQRQHSSSRATNSDNDRATSEGSNGVQILTNNIARGTNNMMDILFGTIRPILSCKPISFEMDSFTTSVSPRTLLPSSVIFSEATESWVATVNTSQKILDSKNVEESSKALRAFSVPTKKQAMCLARAWAPPRMYPFSSNPKCFICETQFAVFRRACHCRNCGVCMCSVCAVQWPSKMLPATYNIKSEDVVKICRACDWLCSAFRLALLHGDYDKAIALHATENVNLTTPFANIKGEVFYPVHCAVLGGNLSLLKWLIDENCCPLRSIRVGRGGSKATNDIYTPILTSFKRSLLHIALSKKYIDIVRYLVVEKHMPLCAEMKDIPIETLVENLDTVLRILPKESAQGSTSAEMSTSSTFRASVEPEDSSGVNRVEDCIICFSNPIDCVVTPCGHQICCLECSKNISRCPVCSTDCSFIRVFRA